MVYNTPKNAPMQSIAEVLQRMSLAQPGDAQQTTIGFNPVEIYPREEGDEYEYTESASYNWEIAEEFTTEVTEVDCDDYEREYRKPKELIVSETITPIPVLKPLLLDDIGTTVGTLKVLTLDELLKVSLPPREMIMDPFLPSQGLAMIAAARGVGKTHVALGIAYAVATGKNFLSWSAPKPHKVLYIDGEMPLVLLQERLQMIVDMNGQKPEPDFLHILTPDRQDTVMPDLSTHEGRLAVAPLIAVVDLVIIDNNSCLFRRGNENEAIAWQATQDWALDWRRLGKTIIFIQHTGRSGQNPRGNSKREDILDTVIILKHSENYDASEGARFEVHFTKARHFRGDEATPFEAHLTEDNGKSVWKVSNISPDALTERVAELYEGNSIKEIGKALGLTKSQVETQIKKARKQMLIDTL